MKPFYEFLSRSFMAGCVISLMAIAATRTHQSAQASESELISCRLDTVDPDLCLPGQCPFGTDCYTGPNASGACCY